jgi:V8-like Glu-specific endopeptidase
MKKLFILAFGFISACGPSSSQNVGSVQSQTLDQEQSLFPNVRLACAQSSCPNSVGMLLGKLPDRSNYGCTSFVVGENVMATNDHCIPDDLQAGDSCSSRIEVTFTDSQKTKCQKIIWRSNDHKSGKMSLDMAYFSVSGNSGRTPLPINKDGLDNNQEVTVYKVDPPTNGRNGTLVADKCRVAQGTFIYPYLKTKDSAAFVLLKDKGSWDGLSGSCNIIGGNSGSPILDSSGAVRGVLHEGTSGSSSEDTLSSLLFGKRNLPGFQNFAIAVNTSCIPDYNNLSGATPNSCNVLHDPSIDAKERTTNDETEKNKLMATAYEKANSDMQKVYPMFKWALGAKSITRGLVPQDLEFPVPVCTLKTSNVDSRFHGWWGYKNNFSEETYLPTYNMGIQFDDDMRIVPTITQTSDVGLHAKISFEPQNIQDGKPSKLVLNYYGGMFIQTEQPLLSGSILPCK